MPAYGFMILNIHAGIKDDGFDFYASVNSRRRRTVDRTVAAAVVLRMSDAPRYQRTAGHE